MNIGKFAKKYRLNVDTLRFYEMEKLLIPERLANGYRHYNAEHERHMKLILTLKAMDFSLTEIKTILKLDNQQASATCNLLSNALLNQKITAIQQQILFYQQAAQTLSNIQDLIQDNRFEQNQQHVEQLLERLFLQTTHGQLN